MDTIASAKGGNGGNSVALNKESLIDGHFDPFLSRLHTFDSRTQ